MIAVGNFVIGIDHPHARDKEKVGGKGLNTARVQALRSNMKGVNSPPTRIATAFAYKHLVFGNVKIMQHVKRLEALSQEMRAIDEELKDLKATLNTARPEDNISHVKEKISAKEAQRAKCDGQIKAVSQTIREAIKASPIPKSIRQAIGRAFRELDAPIAVRSSANCEDLREYAAAGQAESFLNVTSEAQAVDCYQKVVASLFNDGFVSSRIHQGVSHLDAKMPVLFQQLVGDVKAAGVATSIHPSGRPIYVITAKPGLGESVVQGQGTTDTWYVNLRADVILEKKMTEKTSKVIPRSGGGTETVEIKTSQPCLTDAEVLRLAAMIKPIHHHYRKRRWANNVDVEFVVDGTGDIHIVQVRSESLRNMQTNDEGKLVLTVTAVDEKRIPADIEALQLDEGALVAQAGAVVGELQIVASPRLAKAGVIAVTHHTNNDWNDKFAQFEACITEDGGLNSHAAKNSRALGIACVVSARGVIHQLRSYNGRIVTFDAELGKIYLGKVPIKTETRVLEIWVSDPEKLKEIRDQREVHELFRSWEENQARRPEVFIEDVEGRWRRRSNRIGYFQIDYYYKAWDRLTDFLNEAFDHRQPFRLTPLEREIKQIRREGDWRAGLYQHMTTNDSSSTSNIFYFLSGVRDIDVFDFRKLYRQRWQAFQDFKAYIEPIEVIHQSNVEALVDRWIDLFKWMHFAYWLNACVDRLYVFDQLEGIDSSFQDMFKDVAVKALLPEERVDLSREKDKEMYALLEQIRFNSELRALFTTLHDAETIELGLDRHFPKILDTIHSWSLKYKATSEDLDRLSDTREYIAQLRERLIKGDSLGLKSIAVWYQTYVDSRDSRLAAVTVEEIRQKDLDLFWLLKGYARELAADVSKAIQAVASYGQEVSEKEKKVEKALSHFPRLKEILVLSRFETTLREDGHHYIVQFQRKLAKMMLKVAEQQLDLLGEPGTIFDISTDEFIALFKEDDPQYLKLTFDRWKKVEEAEASLQKWATHPQQAWAEFSNRIHEAIEILEQQKSQATYPRVIRYYESEQRRLKHRVDRLRNSIPLEPRLPVQNPSDRMEIHPAARV